MDGPFVSHQDMSRVATMGSPLANEIWVVFHGQ